MTKQDPVEGRQKETNPEIMTKQDPVEGRQRETNPEIMTKQDPVEGRQRETNPEIMTKQDPVEGRQRETNPEIMTKQDPVEGRRRETNPEIMAKQDPVEGRQRETNLEIMTKQDPVEGRQSETKEDKPGNHVVTKSLSLPELRTPSAEAVLGKRYGKSFKIWFRRRFGNSLVESLINIRNNGVPLPSAAKNVYRFHKTGLMDGDVNMSHFIVPPRSATKFPRTCNSSIKILVMERHLFLSHFRVPSRDAKENIYSTN